MIAHDAAFAEDPLVEQPAIELLWADFDLTYVNDCIEEPLAFK